MTRRAILAAIGLTLAVPTLHGQVSSPLLGYVLDPEAGLVYRVQGLPGAPALGAPVDVGGPVQHVALGSARRGVVVIRRDGVALAWRPSGGPGDAPGAGRRRRRCAQPVR